MMDFGMRSVNPTGTVVHAFGIRALDLTEAFRVARRFAGSVAPSAPEGKNWSGCCVGILDGGGRHQISLPMVEARQEPRGLQG